VPEKENPSVLNQYGPIVIFAVIAAAFPIVLLWLAKFIRPSFKPTPEKVLPYECGITPESDARGRYTVRFYVIAILFVIFDVETVYLYPWAVQYQALGLFGLVEMLVFLGILIIGYVWLWKRGALDWI
jgi:NADH-quinone oxidoreductase subunit A